jgi:predicted alpha/beta hydrolase
MGEDLPLGVYKDWRKWCRYPNYFFEDPDMRGIDKPYSTVKASIRAVNSVDDLWAPPQSRDAFMKAYTQSRVELIDLQPAEVGMPSIGHMGYFRPQAKPLWEKTLQWFQS